MLRRTQGKVSLLLLSTPRSITPNPPARFPMIAAAVSARDNLHSDHVVNDCRSQHDFRGLGLQLPEVSAYSTGDANACSAENGANEGVKNHNVEWSVMDSNCFGYDEFTSLRRPSGPHSQLQS
jgi:hypothetical protein